MSPILFTLAGVPIPSYHTIITVGIFVGIFVFVKVSKKLNIPDILAIDSAIIVLLSGFIGARLFHVIFELPKFYYQHPSKIFAVWEGGFVFYGGVVLPLIFLPLYLYKKRALNHFLPLTDSFSLAISIGSFIGRWGCFFQGCCYGRPSNMPWAVVFHNAMGSAPIGVPVHPTQIYMSAYNLIIFLILLLVFKKYYKQGSLTFLYLSLYALSRFIVEFFRADYRGSILFLSTSQFIAICMFVVGVFGLHKVFRTCY